MIFAMALITNAIDVLGPDRIRPLEDVWIEYKHRIELNCRCVYFPLRRSERNAID